MHVVVAQKFYKRVLELDEVVHHVDGNPNNFRKENLIIMKKKDHMKLHSYMKKKNLSLPRFLRLKSKKTKHL